MIDNEQPLAPAADIDAHLAGCLDCRRWLEVAHRVTREARVGQPLPPADLPDRVVARWAARPASDPATESQRDTRLALLGVAAFQTILVAPVLLLGHDHAAPRHVAHELGSLDLALAIGFVVAALRPSRALGMLPIVGWATVLLAVTAGVDLIAGGTDWADEVPHVLDAAGFLLLRHLAANPPPDVRLRWPRLTWLRELTHRRPHAVVWQRARRSLNPVVVRRVAAVVIATGALVVGAATAASAHAVLESTTPAAGAVVATSPTFVTLRFGEPVEITPAAIRVYDDHLRRVDEADAGHITGRGDTVGVHLRSNLANGTYTVTYRVISADSHPVAGGFTFSVGAPSKVLGVATGLGGGSKVVGLSLGAARFVEYAGLVVGLGGLVFFILWPAGRRDRKARRVVFGGLVTLFVGSAAAFLLEAPYAAGEGLGTMFDGRVLSTIATSHFGIALTMRVIVLALALALYRVLLSRGRLGYPFSVVGLAVVLADTFADAGHSAINDNYGLALLSDGAHVLAVSIWLGGLVMLVTVVLRAHPHALRSLLPRFSTVALTCIAVIIGTGTYQAIRNVGYWSALTSTTYGRLVLAKIGGLVVILGLGYVARRFVTRHYASPARIGWPRWPRPVSDGPGTLAVDAPVTTPGATELSLLRRGLLAEIVTGVAVLAVTAVLVATLQGKTAYAAPVSRTIVTSTLRLDVEVDPAKAGPAIIHVFAYTPAGQVLGLQQVTGSLRLPARDVGPLPVPFTIAGPGHALASLTLQAAGDWQLVMTVQTSPIDSTVVATTIPVR